MSNQLENAGVSPAPQDRSADNRQRITSCRRIERCTCGQIKGSDGDNEYSNPRVTSLKSLKRNLPSLFWKLPEGKNYQEFADGSFRFMVNGVTIHMLPDELLTEEEFQKKGGSFKRDSRLVRGNTRWGWKKTNFDTKSVQYQKVNALFMVTDYQEPTFEIYIQTFYPQGDGIQPWPRMELCASAMAKARRCGSTKVGMRRIRLTT